MTTRKRDDQHKDLPILFVELVLMILITRNQHCSYNKSKEALIKFRQYLLG